MTVSLLRGRNDPNCAILPAAALADAAGGDEGMTVIGHRICEPLELVL
jgi:hypothetical protein